MLSTESFNYRSAIIDLQKDWKEYGPENFSFDILETLEMTGAISYTDREELNALEERWLEKLQPCDDKGYNRRPKKK